MYRILEKESCKIRLGFRDVTLIE